MGKLFQIGWGIQIISCKQAFTLYEERRKKKHYKNILLLLFKFSN